MTDKMYECYSNSLTYEFDVEGHTIEVCKLKRKFCPCFGGKCPALVPRGDKK